MKLADKVNSVERDDILSLTSTPHEKEMHSTWNGKAKNRPQI